jgi:hypothetical protein
VSLGKTPVARICCVPYTIALVRLHVGLHILRRHEPHFMPLLLQRPAKKVCSSTSFHADQFHLQVRRKAQQLLARKLLAHHNLPPLVKPKPNERLSYRDQCRSCAAAWDASFVRLLYPTWVKAADHPIS